MKYAELELAPGHEQHVDNCLLTDEYALMSVWYLQFKTDAGKVVAERIDVKWCEPSFEGDGRSIEYCVICTYKGGSLSSYQTGRVCFSEDLSPVRDQLPACVFIYKHALEMIRVVRVRPGFGYDT